jgi:RimJ/RimL family protein N-acetyltransferase
VVYVFGYMDASCQTSDVTLEPRDALILADGTHVRFRPLGPADRDGLAALFDRLSAESRYRRFLSPKPKLMPRELAYLTDADRFQHEAIAAIDPRDGSIVGVGRYIRDRDQPAVAEVAFEVADELQGMGIGTALAARIVQHARAHGIARLTAATLWESRPARRMLRGVGFRARTSRGGVVELDLQLDSAAEPRRVASGPISKAPDAYSGTAQTLGQQRRSVLVPEDRS